MLASWPLKQHCCSTCPAAWNLQSRQSSAFALYIPESDDRKHCISMHVHNTHGMCYYHWTSLAKKWLLAKRFIEANIGGKADSSRDLMNNTGPVTLPYTCRRLNQRLEEHRCGVEWGDSVNSALAEHARALIMLWTRRARPIEVLDHQPNLYTKNYSGD